MTIWSIPYVRLEASEGRDEKCGLWGSPSSLGLDTWSESEVNLDDITLGYLTQDTKVQSTANHFIAS